MAVTLKTLPSSHKSKAYRKMKMRLGNSGGHRYPSSGEEQTKPPPGGEGLARAEPEGLQTPAPTPPCPRLKRSLQIRASLLLQEEPQRLELSQKGDTVTCLTRGSAPGFPGRPRSSNSVPRFQPHTRSQRRKEKKRGHLGPLIHPQPHTWTKPRRAQG